VCCSVFQCAHEAAGPGGEVCAYLQGGEVCAYRAGEVCAYISPGGEVCALRYVPTGQVRYVPTYRVCLHIGCAHMSRSESWL